MQWHFRTKGAGLPPQPVLKDFRNIECRDAVLAYDRIEYVMNEAGLPVSRWDGKTTKSHAVTGKDVPDERAQVPLERYVNPRQAEWPQADYVVGNPPFIGNKRMRDALGDGYVDALRRVWRDMPESADFVMYWWHHAGNLARRGDIQRFGFITTNSLTQTFNRRVVEAQLAAEPSLSLVYAIPDHPWVDSADGAAVRIAMTVGAPGSNSGRLLNVVDERQGNGEGLDVTLAERDGRVNADLTIGADVSGAQPLVANGGISSPGFKLHGAGFIVSRDKAAALGLGRVASLERHIREYRNGKDLAQTPRDVLVIDLFGLTSSEVRSHYPDVYQWVVENVKSERDHNNRKSRRDNWWTFGEPNPKLRSQLAGMSRYIATVETSKHRTFQFLDASIAPDNMLVVIAINDAYSLGVLSSQVHVCWSLAAGGTLEDRPRYNKSRCFEPFPFPIATPEQQAHIRALAEELDAHRKRQQAAHPELTLTGMYNVLEKLKSGAALTAKEKTLHELGLVSVLKSLHDELDGAVLAAYGWSDLAPLLPEAAAFADAVLARLVALNAERVAEEARGQIHWLRPAFQAPAPTPQQTSFADDAGLEASTGAAFRGASATSAIPRAPWPATLPEQVAAVARVLAETRAPLAEADLAARFTGKGPWKKRLPQLLDTLVALGRARALEDGRWMG